MCVQGTIAEDNARFILLAFVLAAYMLAGAALFQKLESDVEIKQAQEFWRVYQSFRRHHLRGSSQLALHRLHELLYVYGNASASGIINKRRRWDFPGSFHFVGTIVSTIGYGSTVPQTPAGKAAVVLYGFFGCSGGILFFNLFLERIITFLAWILRSLHLRRLKRRLRQTTLASSRRLPRSSRRSRVHRGNKQPTPPPPPSPPPPPPPPSIPDTDPSGNDGNCNGSSNGKPAQQLPDILDEDEDEDEEEDAGLDHWKPSVYWVMLYLSLTSCAVACCAAALYATLEGWTYLEALYFCFVSFATIGFGDYVSTQRPDYPYVHLYRFANFLFLVVGCCCIYSLLNVTSIVIKQGLNYVIRKLSCQNRFMAAPHLPRRRSTISAIYYANKRRPAKMISRDLIRPSMDDQSYCPNDNNNNNNNNGMPRRMSGELISMKEFLSSNKVSLAVMQKQLYETAQMQYLPSPPALHHHYHHRQYRYPAATPPPQANNNNTMNNNNSNNNSSNNSVANNLATLQARNNANNMMLNSSSNSGNNGSSNNSCSTGAVGPLAIAIEKFESS
ncbi:potassium channel subfamily K member 13-like [Trichogramma pretiosum]|uniref:potassium channel subfamily K member 13-like n=1 Tax=Trichogramma pretiosum TaxID=7493 RepID=UPI0006C9C2DF|nr:potassium channel subfamily K member 13-like [Trichogramma pretiosum]